VPKRVDGNQDSIAKALSKLGYSVHRTHMVGDGFPDIVVGAGKTNYLFEIKNPDMSPSKRKLSPDEEIFHLSWQGQVDVILSLHDALEVING